jgi:protein SCO1
VTRPGLAAWLACLAWLAPACCGASPVQSAPDSTGSALDPQEALAFSQAVVGKTLGEHVLYDRNGKAVRLSSYRGKPLVVSFIYTGCFQVCPTTTKRLATAVRAAQKMLGRDSFTTVSIGFNLPFDSPQAMASYARQQGIDLPNWDFLSPDPRGRDGLVRDFGFSYVATPKGFDHVIQASIVDAQGRVYRQIYGDFLELPMLAGPLKELLTQRPSAAPGIPALIEKVRLLCTVYDPASGKYRLNYALFIEILVGATIIGAGSYSLFREWRRQRKARRV